MADSQDITQVSAQSDMKVSFLVKVTIPIVGVVDGDIEPIWLKSISSNQPTLSEGMNITTTANVIPLKVATPTYEWNSYESQGAGSSLNSIWGSSISNIVSIG
ncbi:hypothetical protein MHK_000486, partial [Candidatus Magnetomorum sp. HK-1]